MNTCWRHDGAKRAQSVSVARVQPPPSLPAKPIVTNILSTFTPTVHHPQVPHRPQVRTKLVPSAEELELMHLDRQLSQTTKSKCKCPCCRRVADSRWLLGSSQYGETAAALAQNSRGENEKVQIWTLRTKRVNTSHSQLICRTELESHRPGCYGDNSSSFPIGICCCFSRLRAENSDLGWSRKMHWAKAFFPTGDFPSTSGFVHLRDGDSLLRATLQFFWLKIKKNVPPTDM